MNEIRGLGACLLAAGLLTLCAAPAHAAAPAGTLQLAGWFDQNRDGQQDRDEPKLTDYTDLSIRSLDGGEAPEVTEPGVDELTVQPGSYELVSTGYQSTTESPLQVTVPAGGSATASMGLYGHTVSGRAWTDANIDGIRQPGEPARPGVRITARNAETITNPDGGYTLSNVASDEGVTAPAATEDGPLLPSPPDQVAGTFSPADPDAEDDSDFQADGSTGVLSGAEEFEHIDLGVVPGAYDQKVELATDRDTEALRVGDEFVATITLRGWNGLPARREADVALPSSGVTVVGSAGDGWPVEAAPEGGLLTIRPTEPQPIGTFHLIKVRFRVNGEPEQPAELSIRLNGRDSNTANDEAAQPIQVS